MRRQERGLDQIDIKGFEIRQAEADKICREVVLKAFQVGITTDAFGSDYLRTRGSPLDRKGAAKHTGCVDLGCQLVKNPAKGGTQKEGTENTGENTKATPNVCLCM